MKNLDYDYAFIGSGISCSYTLINLIGLLRERKGEAKVKIIVFEKDKEFWTGIPYGTRSGNNSLIITKLSEFIPEIEKEAFKSWVVENIEKLTRSYQGSNPELFDKWLANNHNDLNDKKFDDLYLPRYWFGDFLKEKTNSIINNAVQDGLIDITLENGEVHDITKEIDYFKVDYNKGSNNNTLIITSRVVILTNGGLENRHIKVDELPDSDTLSVISDPYIPTLDFQLNEVYNSIVKVPDIADRNLLIIGSNASSLEFIYNLQEKILPLLNCVHVISNDGEFPYLITETSSETYFETKNLGGLKERGSFTAEEIILAAKQDVEAAKALNLNINDICGALSKSTFELLNLLPFNEQANFVYKNGLEFVKLIRRAGHEYRNTVEYLKELDKIKIITGRFSKLTYETASGQPTFEYLTLDGGVKQFDGPALSFVINCSGFEDLTTTKSILVRNLIKKSLVEVNKSFKGFYVTKSFEASRNLYVMGPMLAGNINDTMRLWHAESASRIFNLSQLLAKILEENLNIHQSNELTNSF